MLIEFKTIGVLRYPDTDRVVYTRHTRINGMRLNDAKYAIRNAKNYDYYEMMSTCADDIK